MSRQKSGQFAKGASGNPKGRPRKDAKKPDKKGLLARMDGWFSMLTGVGTSTYDKRLGQDFCADVVTPALARELWRGDDLAARAIDLPADDMTRAGFDFTVQDDKSDEANKEKADAADSDSKKLQEEIEDDWKELGLIPKLKNALGFEGAYGGAAILIGAKDATEDLSQPLDLATVRSVDYLTVLEARELVPYFWYTNPQAPKYGEVSVYQLAPIGQGQSADGEIASATQILIHESRLAIFPGIRVSREDLAGTNGWGDGKLTRMWRVLRDFNIAWDGTGVLLSDFSQAVFKMKDLAILLGTQDGEETLQKRLRALELSRSICRAAVIDEEESLERQTTNVTGLAELLREYMSRMASAADMPVTRLFGTSPAGLNATGESDITLWYDRVSAMQEQKVIPHLEYITEILLAARKKKVGRFTITARPLWQPSEKEIVETRKVQADTDAIYMSNSVLSADEVAQSRFGGDTYSIETVVDFDDRAALEAELEKEEKAAEAQAEALAQNNNPNPEDPPAPEANESAEDLPDEGKE